MPKDGWGGWQAIQTVDSALGTTCKACLRANPGSKTKERAWHRVVRGQKHTTMCGVTVEAWWHDQPLLTTYKDPQVTCGRCLRSMKAKRRRAAA